MFATDMEMEVPSRPRSSRRGAGHQAAAAELARRLAARPAHNIDNLTRTAFYLRYWQAHPEVTWALLAHLVSRNAGYQMTDLRRHIERFGRALRPLRALELAALGGALLAPGRSARGGRWLERLGGRLSAAARPQRPFELLFRFLEAGNYLIFHDAYPQLVAYAAAKHAYLATGCPTAVRVIEDVARLGVDPGILAVWTAFFEEGARRGFFRDVPDRERRAAPAVVGMALASVVNEQCYLEDRLLSPAGGAPRYVDAGTPFAAWFDAAAALGLTRLVFPVAAPEAPHRAARLLVHVLGAGKDGAPPGPWWSARPLRPAPRPPSFASLDARIDIGRALYFGLFLIDPERADGVTRWAVHGPAHTGERSVYDPDGYAPVSRRPGLLSRALPRGPLSDWPGPPSDSLPVWSGRFARASWDVEPLRVDPFAAPAGWEAPIESSRTLAEVVDPVRIWRG